MDRVGFLRIDRSAFIHRVATNIEHPPHYAFSDWHGNGCAGIDDFVAAFEPFGAGHGDGPDPIVTEVLLRFECQLDLLVLDFKLDSQGVVYSWQLLHELDIYDWSDDLNDVAFIHIAPFV